MLYYFFLHHVNFSTRQFLNKKSAILSVKKYNEIITLLSAINLKSRSLSLGKRPQDSIANSGRVAAVRFDMT